MNTTREPIVLSWSGGKDSTLALAALRADDRFDVVGLLTSVTRGYDRISIHGVRRTLLAAQAEALGVPVHEATLEPACTNEDYERAFLDAVARLRAKHPGLERIAFGDLFLEDVRRYRELLAALPESVDRCGEHGEFHTFVWDGPIFARLVPVARGEVVVREERFAYCDLIPV